MAELDFNLPKLKEGDLPTLDSILNEDEKDIYNFEGFNSIITVASKSDDGTTSITSVALPAPKISLNDLLKPKKPNIHGSVLRHVVLKKISLQMIDASQRRDAGLPTSIAVSNLTAIGMSHGLVLVFEPCNQVLKLVLGNTTDGLKYGAVTALGINVDCTRLLCGYARGQITMWDLNNGNCLRLITEAHPAGYAVLHVQFTDDPTVAMLNDSSGSVYTLSFKRMLTRTCESSCFFSGSKGEVCTMVPLHMSPNLKDSPLYSSSLLAMASLTKLIIVNMRPSPTAVFTQKLSGPTQCLPLLSWNFTIKENKDTEKQVIPVLAFARNQTIIFYEVSKSNESFIFHPFRTMKLNYVLVSMSWVNSQIIITIDTLERIRTVDVKSEEELECLDLGSVNLVYGSSYFKSLATGGNVSEALKLASERVCYQSVQVYNGQIILLGTKSIHCLSLRLWRDRLDFFVKRNEFVEALQLAKLFYEGKGKAVLGLAASVDHRKSLVSKEITNILLAYLDVAMTVNCPKTNDDVILSLYFKSLVPISIEYCLLIGQLNVLFEDVYERFADDTVARNQFLEGLEIYILDDKVTLLSPVLMQDLIDHYEKTKQLHKLEACFVHLDLSSVDIDYMVKLCWTHKLYDLVVYVYNKGLIDYLTPFEKLVKILREALHSGHLTKADTVVGCKLLVYISCCLAGNQYPIGVIEKHLAKEVKDDMFNLIIMKHSEFVGPSETYPHIRALLLFDTREFLNVLFMAFEENEFENVDHAVAVGAPLKRQKVVDILLNVMMNDASFSPSQLGCLFTFIARQMAKHERSIHVNKHLFEQVLEFLTNPDQDQRKEEREQALLELLTVGGLQQFEDEHILFLSEPARFYRVCETVYRKKKQYAKVLSCYWRDASRKAQVFAYIDEMLNGEAFTDFEKEDISSAVLASIDQLVQINSIKFAQLIISHFPSSFVEVSNKLKAQPEIQYIFLKGVFQAKNTAKLENEFYSGVHEQFISLMVQYEPESVHRYLQSTDKYRLEEVLAIVQPKKLVHATSYLLEKLGDVQSAFKLLCDDLRRKSDVLDKRYRELNINESESDEVNEALLQCGVALKLVTGLCQRNSQRLESDQREELWFPLLETVMAPQRYITDTSSNHFLVYKEFTKDVLMNMMTFISLPALLQKIMQDPAYSKGKFGEMKELILGMLETYNYELTLLETTTNLLGKDLHAQYDQERKCLSQGFAPSKYTCSLCSRQFSIRSATTEDSLVVFRCGHAYHNKCLQSSVGFNEEMICVQCNVGIVRNVRRTNSVDEKSKQRKPFQKKKEELKVNLDEQQELALASLHSRQNRVSKFALLAELNGQTFTDWALNTKSRALSMSIPPSLLTATTRVSTDEKFKLKLAPPSETI